jgi:mono/diheme cytochrome c family protein
MSRFRSGRARRLTWLRGLTLLVVIEFGTACGGIAVPTTVAPSGDIVGRGKTLYAANCAQCHGDALEGTNQGPSFLSQVYEPGHHGDGAFLLAVVRGVPAHHWSFGDMPPVDGLSPEDVTAIVAFVRDVQQREGFTD